jgi:FKBP-type peptidyl-prolyl cis-trans isomerase FklB
MRTLSLPFALSLTLVAAGALAEERVELSTKEDRINYGVGYHMGSDLKRQGVSVNAEALVRGIEDAAAGEPPAMSQKEMTTTLIELKRRTDALEQQALEEEAAKNLATAQAFLAENAEQEGVVSLPSGLQYKVIQAGSGRQPGPEDQVTVHYRGTLIDGREFDSSHKRGKPASFTLDRVIAGWREGLPLMAEGAKWQLFVPPELGYGESKSPQIPPNSVLVFEVELLSVDSPVTELPGVPAAQ